MSVQEDQSVIVRQCRHDPSANLKHTYINSCASDILKTILIGLLLLLVRLFSSFEIMAFLLIIVLLSTTGTLIDSANNKTDCDLKPNNSSCIQVFQCAQSPCEMLCSLFQAPRETREGEGEGTKTRGWGRGKEGKKRSL